MPCWMMVMDENGRDGWLQSGIGTTIIEWARCVGGVGARCFVGIASATVVVDAGWLLEEDPRSL